MARLLRSDWHPAAEVAFHSLLYQKVRNRERHLKTLKNQGLNGSADP